VGIPGVPSSRKPVQESGRKSILALDGGWRGWPANRGRFSASLGFHSPVPVFASQARYFFLGVAGLLGEFENQPTEIRVVVRSVFLAGSSISVLSLGIVLSLFQPSVWASGGAGVVGGNWFESDGCGLDEGGVKCGCFQTGLRGDSSGRRKTTHARNVGARLINTCLQGRRSLNLARPA